MNPTIIMTHGMWSQDTTWDNWQAPLQAAGYNTVALNLPGHEHGCLPYQVAGKSLQDYVDFVAAEAAKHEEVILMGHSMGGLISQMVATRIKPKAMVLVNSAVPAPIFPLGPSSMPGTLRSFSRPSLYWTTIELLNWEMDWLLFNATPAEQRPAERAKLVAESGKVAWQIAFGGLNVFKTNRADWSKIDCPVLYLAGGQDRIVPAALGSKLKELAASQSKASFELRTYPQHAHMMIIEPENQQRVAEIAEWLGQHA